MLELYEGVQRQHKVHKNLMNYQKVYYVHVFMHVPQFNLILFEGNISYDLKVSKKNEIVQLLHKMTTEFLIDIEQRKKKQFDQMNNIKQVLEPDV